ncbi:VOC family protein [Nocardia colli]|uniref:VOC family protein n=1 Tax=Nocardia colli TaxID=2545717 RepID=UPI0035E1DB27
MSDRNSIICCWVPDVGVAAAEYTAAGLPAQSHPVESGFQHGGWRLDERYVELLTVLDETAFGAHAYAKAWPALSDRAARAAEHGGGAIGFAVDVGDAAATAERLRAEGRQVLETELTFDYLGVGVHEVFVLDAPDWAPFFVTYRPPRALPPVNGVGGVDPGRLDLSAIVIETPDPGAAAVWLGRLLRIPCIDSAIPMAGGALVFVPGPADRIVEVVLTGPEPAYHTIAGLRFCTLEPNPVGLR